MIWNHKYFRYVVLLPLVIMVIASVYFSRVTAEINEALMDEKRLEKQMEVDLICDQIDTFLSFDNDWGVYDYEAVIAHSLALLDSQAYTFAALYSNDLINVSDRTPSYISFFDPLDDVIFKDIVQSTDRGTHVLVYEPTDDVARDMYIYYRWIPTDESLGGRYLAVIAVSQFSITNNIESWVGMGAVVLIAVVTILNMVSVALLIYLGHIFEQRHGPKHRGAL